MRPPYFFTICNPPPPGNSSVLLYAYGSGLLNQFLWQQTSTFDLGIIQGSNPFYKLVKVCFFKTKMDFWYLKARVEWTLDTWPCLCSHCSWFLHLRNWAFIRIWWIWSVQYEGHHQCNGSTDIDPKYNGAQLCQESYLLVKLQSDVKGVGWNQAYGLLAPHTSLLQPAITWQFHMKLKSIQR